MTLSEIKSKVKYISRKDAEEKLNRLILSAIAAQGDKKSIEKVLSDFRKTLSELS